MSEYPQATRLLHRLMGVARRDRDMPLSVLINLHRAQLRAPLVGVVALGQIYGERPRKAVDEAKRVLDERYPKLRAGYCFERNSRLNVMPSFGDDLTAAGAEQLGKMDTLTQVFFEEANNAWSVYEPCALIFALTLPGTRLSLLSMLEIELRLESEAARSVLQLAGKKRPGVFSWAN